MKHAEKLLEIRDVLIAGPLTTDQLAQFYKEELRKVRGEDIITEFARDLREDAVATPRRWFHRFLSGHPGVGKSTEFSRLEQRLTGEFEVVYLNAQTELNPALFHSLDLILVLMKAATDRAKERIGKKKVPSQAAESMLEAMEWLGETKETKRIRSAIGVSGKAGIGPAPSSLIAKAFGFFAQVQGETRYRVENETLKTPHRVKPVGELLNLANSVFDACERICRGTSKDPTVGQFLFLVDNFEKPDFDPNAVQQLFVEHSQLLADLSIHYIITMPVERANSTRIRQVTLYQHGIRIVPDVPVFERDFSSHDKGRAALKAVLMSRVNLEMFAQGQIERLIVACAGNLRDLFELIIKARGLALNESEDAVQIEERQVTAAIEERRTYYQRQLYSDEAADIEQTPYKDKLQRLAQFYRQEPATERDTIFYALLRARALQEFADARVAVHPLVVDLLYAEGLLASLPPEKMNPKTSRPLGSTI